LAEQYDTRKTRKEKLFVNANKANKNKAKMKKTKRKQSAKTFPKIKQICMIEIGKHSTFRNVTGPK
jgi:hypothetical protein